MTTIFQDPEVSEALDDAVERWPRAEDAWMTFEWAVVRDPEVGEPLTESGKTRTITLEGARSIGLPTLTVVYVIESDSITVKRARFEEPRHPRAGSA